MMSNPAASINNNNSNSKKEEEGKREKKKEEKSGEEEAEERERGKREDEPDEDDVGGEEEEEIMDEEEEEEEEFSDVVVLDPLGVEELADEDDDEEEEEHQPANKKLLNNPPHQQQQEEDSAKKPPTNSSPIRTIAEKTANQQPKEESVRLRMDPPSPLSASTATKYPNLSPSQPAPPSGQSAAQSWFSSHHLPASFLSGANGKSPHGPDDQPNNDQHQSSATSSIFHLLGQLRANLQPWATFFRLSKFGWPPGLVAVGPRVKHNLRHFLSNYLCLFLILLVYCILTSLLMLLTLIVLAGLCYTIYQRTQKGPVIVAGQEIPPSLLYTLALMVCIPLFYLANAGSLMYWVLGTGMFLMLAHSVFYASEEVPGQEFEVVTA